MSTFKELDTFLDSEEANFGLTPRARQLVRYRVSFVPGESCHAIRWLTHLSRFYHKQDF